MILGARLSTGLLAAVVNCGPFIFVCCSPGCSTGQLQSDVLARLYKGMSESELEHVMQAAHVPLVKTMGGGGTMDLYHEFCMGDTILSVWMCYPSTSRQYRVLTSWELVDKQEYERRCADTTPVVAEQAVGWDLSLEKSIPPKDK